MNSASVGDTVSVRHALVCLGGAKRDRTADLLRARQALSQLSYGPFKNLAPRQLVGLGRFELPTSPLSGVRSNQLSYRPWVIRLNLRPNRVLLVISVRQSVWTLTSRSVLRLRR